MEQVFPRFCPRCNAPAVPGQRFCVNCGLTMTTAPQPMVTVNTADPQPQSQFSPVSQQPAQPQPPWRITGSPDSLASSRPPSNRTSGRTGLVLILVSIIILLVAGSLLGAIALGFRLPGSLGGIATQPPITTSQMNSTVTYAGVDLTIVTVQQSQSFIDDPNTTSSGMVRLNIQEQNTTAVKVSWLYADIARLLLPDKSVVTPTYVRARVGITPGATQKSIVDFAVPTSDKISQLTLRLGAANEAQLDIPLTGHADLGKYSPQSVKPNGQMLYMGLNWTLVKATQQLSVTGQQAGKEMLYVVVTLQVDNTLSQQAITGSPFDYARLKYGNTTASPTYTDLPVSFDTGETGQTGTITFLVPQSNKAFTLILLPQGGADQATTDFQFA